MSYISHNVLVSCRGLEQYITVSRCTQPFSRYRKNYHRKCCRTISHKRPPYTSGGFSHSYGVIELFKYLIMMNVF